MRCGSCKSDGVDINHVKDCYQTKYSTGDGGPVPDTAAEPLWPASEKQINYVLGLQDERRLPDGYAVKSKTTLERMERDDVSAEITLLKSFPVKDPNRRGRDKQYTMPAGRYALHWEGEGWFFYQVDKPDKGRWKGYTFIKRLIGAPGDYRKIDLSRDDRVEALDAIEEDPATAMKDYGHQAGVCGRCYSPLTNPDSLAAGIGPICAGKGF